MPQNDKRNAKRRTRAERRAEEEARLKEQAAQAEHERKQQTLIGAIVVLVVVALVAVIGVTVYRNTHPSSTSTSSGSASPTSVAAAKKAMNAVKTKPSKANSTGGFLFSKNGYNKTISDAPTISLYMDPICPGCGSMHRQIDSTLASMFDAGQVNLEFHLMTSRDASSSDNYSSRAANAAVYIVEHDDNPEHLLKYIENIYDEDFQPDEADSYVPVSDKKLQEQAEKAGVSTAVASKAFSNTYTAWLKAADTYTSMRPELENVSGNYAGYMTTPTVTINGTYLDLVKVGQYNMSIKDAILTSIGLKESQVGKIGVMPSIGSGKPKAIDTGK